MSFLLASPLRALEGFQLMLLGRRLRVEACLDSTAAFFFGVDVLLVLVLDVDDGSGGPGRSDSGRQRTAASRLAEGVSWPSSVDPDERLFMGRGPRVSRTTSRGGVVAGRRS